MSEEGHPCPTCPRSFDTERGLKLHHAVTHGESLALKEIACKFCETLFEVHESKDQVYCSEECMGLDRMGADNPAWTGGDKDYGDDWPKQREKRIQMDDEICQLCCMDREDHLSRYDKDLHVHHIEARSSGESLEELNRVENLITLCARCHNDVENGKVSINES